jgi:hypothetical protein
MSHKLNVLISVTGGFIATIVILHVFPRAQSASSEPACFIKLRQQDAGVYRPETINQISEDLIWRNYASQKP